MEYREALDEETDTEYVAGDAKNGTITPIEDRGSVWFVDLETTTGSRHKKTVRVISQSNNGRLLTRLKPNSKLEVAEAGFKLRPGKLHLTATQ